MYIEKRRIKQVNDIYYFYSPYHRETKHYFTLNTAIEKAQEDFQDEQSMKELQERLDCF